ncbi:MAG: hypothetical protein EOP02_25350 [Proteobacteria bacterium]|nr:MAG: hypothetical protein EOP02_25350 [Pseudomonadota bacterium]
MHIMSNGRLRRTEGKGGADLTDFPMAVRADKAEQAFKALLGTIDRQLTPKRRGMGASARRMQGEATEAKVLAAFAVHAHKGSGAAGAIARSLGLSARQVRRVLAKKRPHQ